MEWWALVGTVDCADSSNCIPIPQWDGKLPTHVSYLTWPLSTCNSSQCPVCPAVRKLSTSAVEPHGRYYHFAVASRNNVHRTSWLHFICISACSTSTKEAASSCLQLSQLSVNCAVCHFIFRLCILLGSVQITGIFILQIILLLYMYICTAAGHHTHIPHRIQCPECHSVFLTRPQRKGTVPFGLLMCPLWSGLGGGPLHVDYF